MTREEAIERLNIHKSTSVFVDSIAEAIDIAIEALSAEPNCQKCAIKQLWEETEKEDLVEVVRCKDCKWWNYGEDCVRHTEDTMGYTISTTAYDFCSYGERRET